MNIITVSKADARAEWCSLFGDADADAEEEDRKVKMGISSSFYMCSALRMS